MDLQTLILQSCVEASHPEDHQPGLGAQDFVTAMYKPLIC